MRPIPPNTLSYVGLMYCATFLCLALVLSVSFLSACDSKNSVRMIRPDYFVLALDAHGSAAEIKFRKGRDYDWSDTRDALTKTKFADGDLLTVTLYAVDDSAVRSQPKVPIWSVDYEFRDDSDSDLLLVIGKYDAGADQTVLGSYRDGPAGVSLLMDALHRDFDHKIQRMDVHEEMHY